MRHRRNGIVGWLTCLCLGGQAFGNGIVIIPVVLDPPPPPPLTSGQAGATVGWRLQADGSWAPVATAQAPTGGAKRLAFAIVPDPEQPCYSPPPEDPIPHPDPTPSPQSPPDAAAAGQDAGKAKACGRCFPDCFLGTPCGCCTHKYKVLKPGGPASHYYCDAINRQAIASRIVTICTRNSDGTYTLIP